MAVLSNGRFGCAKWIGAGFVHVNWLAPAKPAPFFRKSFQISGKIKSAEVFFCGLGWAELYLNGQKVGDHVLEPAVSQYDRRARYVRYDVANLLKNGWNVFGVILGNGWYDCATSEVWHFDKASWRDYPKFIFELCLNDIPILFSDNTWKSLREDGPIRFNEIRNGEFYDARRELPGWAEEQFDDSGWDDATIVPGPGGILVEQSMPPCKVIRRIPAQNIHFSLDGGHIYDVGENITGWACLKVRGSAGAKVKLRYAECISSYEDQLLQENISLYIKSGEVQTDEYTLKGDGIEEWEPRFTYHGFRYIEAKVTGEAEIMELSGCLVHTAFEPLTTFHSSEPILNKLYECVLRSFTDNFTGIPTDCPHREKNGWLGDALQAAETGLFNYDLVSSYHDWIQTIADVQRPNGQLPGIAPTGGWGFNWGSGPAWDSAFILIPWYVYLYSGQMCLIEENYDGMKRYIEFLDTLASDNLIRFGLGDWCHVDQSRICDTRITSTGYYYADTIVMMKCAELLERKNDAEAFRELAKQIFKSFNHTFYNGDGTYAKGEVTALSCALYQGLCPEDETRKTATKLNALVKANQHRADFGILGAKYVPRALADHGYTETAYRVITQPSFPGWVDWINHGATTLWETWNGDSSRNHIAFGDIAAWMIQYLAGIVPDEKHPGFSALTIKPFAPGGLDALTVSCKLPCGTVKIAWKKKRGIFYLHLVIPRGIHCRVILPDGNVQTQNVPDADYSCRLQVENHLVY